MIPAVAEIPAGVKNYYEYNQQDKSIVIVKKRLQELGYFRQDAQFSNVVSDELKKAVISFQKQNGIDADGVLNKSLLELLFSDDAVEKGGIPIVRSNMISEPYKNTDEPVKSDTDKLPGSVEKEKIVYVDPFVIYVICAVVLFLLLLLFIRRAKKRASVKVNHVSGSLNDNSTKRGGQLVNEADIYESRKMSAGRPQQIRKEGSSNLNSGSQNVRFSQREGKPENEARILELQKMRAERLQQIKKGESSRRNKELHQVYQARSQQIAQKSIDWNNQWEMAEKRKQEEYRLVELYSERLHQLQNMLVEYQFETGFRTAYRLSYVFHSRRDFDEIQQLPALAFLAEENSELKSAFEKVKKNRFEMERFFNENGIIRQSSPSAIMNSGLSAERFVQIEKELCRRMKNKVIVDLTINLDLYYRSVGGNKHDSRLYELNFEDLEKAFSLKPILEIEYISTREEREKMTPGLRYDILRRDGFRCVLCGATADDGVKLHVDHIMPVSKGGKTIPSNLRTLCDRCNFGKRDKYDPNGLN